MEHFLRIWRYATAITYAETVEAIHAEVRQALVVNADGTGFGRCGKDRMWLWVAAGADAQAFRLLSGRGAERNGN